MQILKYLSESLNLLAEISKEQAFSINVVRTKDHALNNRLISIKKIDNKYQFNTTSLIRKGLQTGNEINIRRETEVRFTNNNKSIYSKGNILFLHEFHTLTLIRILWRKILKVN